MYVSIYNCTLNSQNYTIRHAIIKKANTQFIDVFDSEFVQYVVCDRIRKIIRSVSTTKHLDIYNSIVIRFLSNTLDCQLVHSFDAPFIYFQTQKAIFRADIKEEPYHYNIKIGSHQFTSCVDVMVYKPIDPTISQKLAQIYSEPECWNDLVKGNTIDMIKGSLQFIQTVFDVHSFVFDDNSNIEYGITNTSQKAPRKLTTPFSLGHLFLATKGETWYEYNFGATIKDSSVYADYKSHISIFDKSKNLATDDFFKIARMTAEQQLYLQPYYEKAETWREFFTSIPKHKQCFAFYNWLPFFIDGYLLANEGKFEFRKHEWKIDMNNEKFIRTACLLVLNPSEYNSNAFINRKSDRKCKTNKNNRSSSQRTTLKNKVKIISLSNEMIGQTI